MLYACQMQGKDLMLSAMTEGQECIWGVCERKSREINLTICPFTCSAFGEWRCGQGGLKGACVQGQRPPQDQCLGTARQRCEPPCPMIISVLLFLCVLTAFT